MNSGSRKATGKMRFHSKLREDGTLHLTRVMTSESHDAFKKKEIELDHEGIKHKKWSKSKIKAIYTDKYIADLLGRAADTQRAMRGLTPADLGFSREG